MKFELQPSSALGRIQELLELAGSFVRSPDHMQGPNGSIAVGTVPHDFEARLHALGDLSTIFLEVQ